MMKISRTATGGGGATFYTSHLPRRRVPKFGGRKKGAMVAASTRQGELREVVGVKAA